MSRYFYLPKDDYLLFKEIFTGRVKRRVIRRIASIWGFAPPPPFPSQSLALIPLRGTAGSPNLLSGNH